MQFTPVYSNMWRRLFKKTSNRERSGAMILVSACLAGFEVRYDGNHNAIDMIQKLLAENKAVAVCPEVLGGLPTPRDPAEIVGGTGEDVLDGQARVIDIKGKDVTDMFVKGAQITLQKAQEMDATIVVLKENSPSCGSSMIYNGNFTGEKMAGNGVTSALLKRHGIQVISEHEISKYALGELE